MQNKKLYKIEEGKIIDGVCGGIAEYLNLDPTVVRVLWALIACSDTGLIAYLVCALIIPRKPSGYIDV